MGIETGIGAGNFVGGDTDVGEESCDWYGGGGDLRIADVGRGVEAGAGAGRARGLEGLRCCLGVEDPDDPRDSLESVDDFLPALGRTHPSGVAGPRGVMEIDTSGAVLERVWERFEVREDEVMLFFLRRWEAGGLCPDLWGLGGRVSEARERR